MGSLRIARQLFFIIALFSGLSMWQGIAFAADAVESPPQVASTVNINSASAEELAAVLKGVGEKRAEAIVTYRKEHGPFKTLADLQKVKGIGEVLANENASVITF